MRWSVVAGIVAACGLVTNPGRADELGWRSEWRRVGVPEYVVMGSALSGYLAARVIAPKSTEARWLSPILFDAPVRSALRLTTRRARDRAETTADVLEYTLLAQSLVVEPWLVAGWARHSPDVGWELFVLSAQSHSIALLLNATTKLWSARARPYTQECALDPGYHRACRKHDRYRSFYSSHSSIAGTSAGLACAHHASVRLYGDSVADAVACAGTGLVALSVGALRIVSDEHWATDVVTGELIGFAVGFLLPTLLYYREPAGEEVGTASAGTSLRRGAAPPPRVLTWAVTLP